MTLVYHTGQLVRPLFMQAKSAPQRVIYAGGEDERVLRAAQTVVDEQIANPILIGRTSVIQMRLKNFGLRMVVGKDIDIVDPEDDARFNETWSAYYKLRMEEHTSELQSLKRRSYAVFSLNNKTSIDI